MVSHLFNIAFISSGWQQRIMAHQTSWLDVWVDNDATSCHELYVTGFYFAAATWFTVGYGDISPLNSVEQAVSVAVMILGQMVLAKVFADLNWITSTANHQRSQHLSRMAQMRAALSSMGMPKIIINRVLRYTDFVNKLHKQKQM